MVFVYATWYPVGGLRDCALRTNNKDLAVARAITEVHGGQHAHILDVQTGELVRFHGDDIDEFYLGEWEDAKNG